MSLLLFWRAIKGEIKSNLAVSVPLITSQLIFASSGFLGTVMVAHLGQEALAASVLVTSLWFSLSMFFFGILNAVGVLVSHQYGANKPEIISKIMGKAYLLGAVIGMVMLFILSNVPKLLQLSGPPKAVLYLATQYVHAMLWTLPALVILIISEQFLAGVGRSKIVLRVSCIVVPIEIPLIYALIFGKFGLPVCGIAGIGYGFAITYSITAVGLTYYLLSSQYYQKFKIYSAINVAQIHYLKELLRVGLPMGLMHVIEVTSFAVATLWMGHFGTTLLAAHQIVMQFLGFAITLVFAMSQAVTIRIGHAVGNKDHLGVKYAVYGGMLLNFAAIVLIALAFYVSPTVLIRLDVDIHQAANALLLQNAKMLLSICGVLLIFDNFRIIGFGALRGLKDTKFPMYISFISFWLIGLSAAYLFAFTAKLQGRGIWWGLTLGIACGAIIIMMRIRKLLKYVDLDQLIDIKA